MFETISDRLSRTLGKLRRGARLTEDNIGDALREVRRALLEADVALPVTREFLDRVRERAVGQEVLKSLTPGQALVGVVHDELVRLMAADHADLALNVPPPAPLLVAGLQGSGKTTTCAKIARWLAERHGRKALLASCDVYRPAAIEQLRVLAAEVETPFFETAERDPVAIARAALAEARRRFVDFVILDTAGRLHVDEEMMREASAIHAAVSPVETLFVADAMTGQDAVNVARAFNEALPLTGVVLTKADGDARGGAALSVRWVTGKPVKFLGTGEKLDALEAFHPDRIASRILGMGDVLTLIEEAERKVDRDKAEKLARRGMGPAAPTGWTLASPRRALMSSRPTRSSPRRWASSRWSWVCCATPTIWAWVLPTWTRLNCAAALPSNRWRGSSNRTRRPSCSCSGRSRMRSSCWRPDPKTTRRE